MSSYSSDFGGGGYADFLEYMKLKNANIKLQLEERYDQTGKPQIFAGCVVGIDGRTIVLDALLKKLIFEHGGIYEYLDSKKFTHLIADNIALGNQKWRRILSGYKPPYRIVHSKWVTDSVKEGKRLSEAKYMPAALVEHWKIDNNSLITGLMYKKPPTLEAPPVVGTGSPEEVVVVEIPPVEAELDARVTEDSASPESASPETSGGGSPPPILPGRPPSRSKAGVRDINPTRENPNFVRDYFAKSRLHFIGRWKENISAKHRFAALTQHMQVPAHWVLHGAPPGTRWQPAVRYLHVDFDSFFVAVGVKMSTEPIPDPEAFPIAVAHGASESANSTSEIASCNYKAREFGVVKGMYVGAAVQKCPNLKILSYHLDEIARCSNKLMAILALVTNRVSPTSCDEAYLQLVDEGEKEEVEDEDDSLMTRTRKDLLPSPQKKKSKAGHNTGRPYGGLEHAVYIAAWIRQKVLSATDCSVSIGIGDSAFLAKMASKEAKPPNGSGIWAIPLPTVDHRSDAGKSTLSAEDRFREFAKACAKSLYKNECPRGWRVTESRDLNYRLQLLKDYFVNINLSSLHGVGVRTSQQLATMGLTTCNDIMSSSTKTRELVLRELKQQLGDQRGESVFLLAHGIDNRSVSDRSGADSNVSVISVTVNWGVRLFDQADVDDFFRQMGEEAYTRYSPSVVEPQTLSLKLLIRAPDHPKIPIKYGGCGVCVEFTDSTSSRAAVLKTPKDITAQALVLYHRLKENFDVEDIRGITFTLGKFQQLDRQQSRLKNFLHKRQEGEKESRPLSPPPKVKDEPKPIKIGLEKFLVPGNALPSESPTLSNEPRVKEPRAASKPNTIATSSVSPGGPLDQFLKKGLEPNVVAVVDDPDPPQLRSTKKNRKRQADKAAVDKHAPKRSNALLQFMHSAHVQRSNAGRPLLTIIDSSSGDEELSVPQQPPPDKNRSPEVMVDAAACPIVLISEDEEEMIDEPPRFHTDAFSRTDEDTDPLSDAADDEFVVRPDSPARPLLGVEKEGGNQQQLLTPPPVSPMSAVEISSDPSIYSEIARADLLPKKLARLERRLLVALQTDPFKYVETCRKKNQLLCQTDGGSSVERTPLDPCS